MPSNDILQEVNQALAETIDSNTPIKRFSKYKIKSIINSLKPRKSPGYDLITATLLKNLPEEGFTFLTYLYNIFFIYYVYDYVSFHLNGKSLRLK